MLDIAIFGASGRMGRTLINRIAASEDLRLAGAAAAAGEAVVGSDAGTVAGGEALGVEIIDDPSLAVANAAVAIDFTLPAALPANLEACLEYQVPLVLGTTGFSAAETEALRDAAGELPIVYGRNMSVGINLLTELCRLAAQTLGPDYDVEICEAHHRRKVDAPSGTALQLGEVVAAQRGAALDDLAVHERHGRTGERLPGQIGFSVIRAGAIVGDHSVMFGADDELVELRHRAQDRAAFAQGALRAARWLVGRSAGLYGMPDVLGFGS